MFRLEHYINDSHVSDLNMQILQRIKALEVRVDDALKDLGKLKAVLVKKTVAADVMFEARQHNDIDTFEAFCQKLQDDSAYYDLFVSILI